jgi:UDP-2-acetamido-2,6-beta-L-arabino-hexul-4-ose reductase
MSYNISSSTICIVGSDGFIGKNLCHHLYTFDGCKIRLINKHTDPSEYERILYNCDAVFHFAGVNRTENIQDFQIINIELTRKIASIVNKSNKPVKFIYTSSTQASLDNAYGNSKLESEIVLKNIFDNKLVDLKIYRLPGVFGKWSRPNYNTVVATFCYNIINDIDIKVDDPNKLLSLVYIDDVIDEFVRQLNTTNNSNKEEWYSVKPVHSITLQSLVDILYSFKKSKQSLEIPSFRYTLVKKLYSTYISFFDKKQFLYKLDLKKDDRGCLFEWIKSADFGQIFISRTLPGVTRGNHFHRTKSEKFLVIEGRAEICFRHIVSNDIICYIVDGENPEVVDIPTGYAHSIKNIGNSTLITLFWANEIFDSSSPDTFPKVVK